MKAYASRTTADRKSLIGATVGMVLIAALLLALVAAAPARAGSTATIKRAALSGTGSYSAVNGEAKWKVKGGERELEVQIEDAKKLAGKTLTVTIGGKRAGQMKVGTLGRARLVRSTEAGQSVTASVTGKNVRITTAGGKLVATGKF